MAVVLAMFRPVNLATCTVPNDELEMLDQDTVLPALLTKYGLLTWYF